jgi:hypothetical protein
MKIIQFFTGLGLTAVHCKFLIASKCKISTRTEKIVAKVRGFVEMFFFFSITGIRRL